MIGAVPFQNALLMGGYGIGQSWVADPRHPDRLLAVFVGGCAGGILQSFLMSPVELAKVAAQVRHAGAAPLTVRDMARRVAGNLNVGLGATLLRDGVPHGVWFASYEAAKHRLIRLQQERDNGRGVAPWLPVDSPMAPPLLAGAFAATVAWIVGYPADLIKTRLQSGASSSSAGGGGIARTARDIVRDGGGSYLALYRGLGLKLVRAVPASMIGFGTYELVKAEMSSLS
jgi:solute carrier family 25 carnitine/acylcarnitine transporter 20/29